MCSPWLQPLQLQQQQPLQELYMTPAAEDDATDWMTKEIEQLNKCETTFASPSYECLITSFIAVTLYLGYYYEI